MPAKTKKSSSSGKGTGSAKSSTSTTTIDDVSPPSVVSPSSPSQSTATGGGPRKFSSTQRLFVAVGLGCVAFYLLFSVVSGGGGVAIVVNTEESRLFAAADKKDAAIAAALVAEKEKEKAAVTDDHVNGNLLQENAAADGDSEKKGDGGVAAAGEVHPDGGSDEKEKTKTSSSATPPPPTTVATTASPPPSPSHTSWLRDHPDYAPNDDRCTRWVGNPIFKRWRRNKKAICGKGNGDGGEGGKSTTVDLSFVKDTDAVAKFLRVAKVNKTTNDNKSGGIFSFFANSELTSIPIKTQIEIYRLDNFEYVPLIKRYTNVALTDYMFGNIDKLACNDDFATYVNSEEFRHTKPNSTPRRDNAHVTRITDVISDRTVIRVDRFDHVNPYEAFHIYMNMYLVLRTLNFIDEHGTSRDGSGGAGVKNIQFVFTDDQGFEPNDELVWKAFSGNNHPLVYGPARRENVGHPSAQNRPKADPSHGVLVHDVIDAPTAAMSMVSTRGDVSQHGGKRKKPYKVGRAASSFNALDDISIDEEDDNNPLTGRFRDHHCKSNVARSAIRWMRRVFGVPPPKLEEPPKIGSSSSSSSVADTPASPPSKIRVLFSIRRPYWREGRLFYVNRIIQNDEGFVASLKQKLGEDKYEVIAHDFALMTPQQCINATTNAHVFVGAHGGGMMWTAYLPRHGLVVEMFGADRSESNERHYHNIASLFDLHHKSLTLHTVPIENWKMGMTWSEHDVDKVVNHIKQTKFLSNEEPSQ